jgi:hypothetical protein
MATSPLSKDKSPSSAADRAGEAPSFNPFNKPALEAGERRLTAIFRLLQAHGDRHVDFALPGLVAAAARYLELPPAAVGGKRAIPVAPAAPGRAEPR